MKITFIVPPSLDGELPAERTAGCTRLVYPMPNIYELIVAAMLEKEHEVRYRDFVMEEEGEKQLRRFLAGDASDCYMLWSVNLSLATDLKTIRAVREYHPDVRVIVMGPGVTFYTEKLLVDERVTVVRGEPELTVRELVAAFAAQAGDPAGAQDGGIRGISFVRNGKVHHTPAREPVEDLDSLPFPARHFIEN